MSLFGYVRAYKPYMRVFEYDIYRAAYCGLCKDMGRRYGFLTRFTLSYDLTFLALMDFSVRGAMLDAEPQRCVAHPFYKRPCATCRNDYSYTSAAAVLLVWHKLRDDLEDKRGIAKVPAAIGCLAFRGAFKKAEKALPELSGKLKEHMELQHGLEEERCGSLDRACEPTALMMQEVFGGLSAEPEKKERLMRLGYLLGRYIYMTDALDDLKRDYKKGGYNPLLAEHEPGEKHKGDFPEKALKEIREMLDGSVNLTLGEMSDVYVSLELKRFRDILDNIIYLGLKHTYSSVRNGRFNRKKKDEPVK